MIDANNCYTRHDALNLGRALDEVDTFRFGEPVASEDREGYRMLRSKLGTRISDGEAEFTRGGWRDLLYAGCVDIAQPEVFALGGASEYLKVLALAHSRFVPVVNHVWGSAVAVAANIQLLAAMPPLPGGLFPREPMLEFDTTDNKFRDELLTEPLDILGQVKISAGYVSIPIGSGLGIDPDLDFVRAYEIDV